MNPQLSQTKPSCHDGCLGILEVVRHPAGSGGREKGRSKRGEERGGEESVGQTCLSSIRATINIKAFNTFPETERLQPIVSKTGAR
jgi:hypothetical protein